VCQWVSLGGLGFFFFSASALKSCHLNRKENVGKKEARISERVNPLQFPIANLWSHF
jgi:hypothetical protein